MPSTVSGCHPLARLAVDANGSHAGVRWLFLVAILLSPGSSRAIAVEKPDGIAERAYYQIFDADIALNAPALVDTNGCSGTMIGPRTLMTAAHCGSSGRELRWATFVQYRTASEISYESVLCEIIVSGWISSDIFLFWCDLLPDGQAPGDKYGYLDFDLVYSFGGKSLRYDDSRHLLTDAVGAQFPTLYSVWSNPIGAPAPGRPPLPTALASLLIYSEGTIQTTDLRGYYVPNDPSYPFDPPVTSAHCLDSGVCAGGSNVWTPCDEDGDCPGSFCTTNEVNRPLGIASNLWAQPGVSGSSSVSLDAHRVILGPLSQGQVDAPGRSQTAIVDLLEWGWVESDVPGPACVPYELPSGLVNTALLSENGVANPTLFYGYLDENVDGVFDVQNALEMATGEPPKPLNWLGFESQRRNRLWVRDDTIVATVDPDTRSDTFGKAVLVAAAKPSGYHEALRHDHLNLSEGTAYRVLLDVEVLQRATAEAPLRICIGSSCESLEKPVGGPYSMVARLLASPADMGEFPLRILVAGGANVTLSNVSVIEYRAGIDFDSHPQRIIWRNGPEQALMLPRGRGAGPLAPDFAGTVWTTRLGQYFSLESARVGLAPGGGPVRMCFFHREAGSGFIAPENRAVARLTVGGTEIAASRVGFTPSSEWSETCTPPASIDSIHEDAAAVAASFGLLPDTPLLAAYLVDDIRFVPEPATGLAQLAALAALRRLVRRRS